MNISSKAVQTPKVLPNEPAKLPGVKDLRQDAKDLVADRMDKRADVRAMHADRVDMRKDGNQIHKLAKALTEAPASEDPRLKKALVALGKDEVKDARTLHAERKDLKSDRRDLRADRRELRSEARSHKA